MSIIRTSLVAAATSLLALAGAVQAQSANTGSTTTPSETNRGVPGVDVDTGRNASGAVDVNVGRPGDQRTGVPGVDVDVGRNASGGVDVNQTRAPRADRN